MTTDDMQDIANAAAAAASGPVKRPLIWLVIVILGMCGSGGTWAYHTDAHEKLQDQNIARNGRTIRQISVLLVQQGRHFEGMVRAAAGGQPIPGRPRELDNIEAKILESTPVD